MFKKPITCNILKTEFIMYFFLSFISVFLYLCHPGYYFYMLKKKTDSKPLHPEFKKNK